MIHRVRAVNSATQAENKIHDDRIAAQFGFRGGLVPGVTVCGYMLEPILAAAPEWLDCGTLRLRLLEPFFDGDEVIVTTEAFEDGFEVAATREDGTLCATGVVGFERERAHPPALLAEAPLPEPERRPIPSPETIVPGAVLGSLQVALATPTPEAVLQLSNDILVGNFRLGPWIHVASELRNWAAVEAGEPLSVRGRIQDRFDRKGHAFLVADVMILGAQDRLLQSVRHTAIYRLREPETQVIR